MSGASALFLLTTLTLLGGVGMIVGWVFVRILMGLVWVVTGVGRGFGFLIGRAGGLVVGVIRGLSRFVRSEIVDGVHGAGAMLTAGVITPLALLNLVLGRWQNARHYGSALEDELGSAARSFYRVVLGNPIRLLGLGGLTDGIERRIPGVIDRAPRGETRVGTAAFQGYELLGTLPSGGSGARLYIARPSTVKLGELQGRGHADPGKVVIKSFALEEGSSLPEIVRESRALEAASRMGLVLEHELSPRRFHYVMPFVPGEDLGRVTSRLHAQAPPEGLDRRDLRKVMGYATELLRTLERFHANGLWHKDIKPSNLIVSDGRVHVVDLGLVTPLQSALTLTTHGTEYYRDPEMVRLALRGVKVHEVDGVKFDLYSAGAVLYSVIENSFPAHGSLSRLTKRCPEAMQWIVRRAMADLSARYSSARDMLEDVEALLAAKDPFSLRPADLPSVRGSLHAEGLAGDLDGEGPRESLPSFVSGPPRAAEPIELHPAERGRSRRRVRVFAGMAAGCMLSVALASAWQRHRQHTPLPSYVWELRDAGRRGVESIQDFGRRVARNVQAPRLARAEQPTAPVARTSEPSEGRSDRMAQIWRASLRSVLGDAPRSGSTERVLVLETPTTFLDGEVRTALEQALNGLGCEVLGGASGIGAEDLTAGALNAIGLSSPDDPEAAGRVRQWIDASDEVDRVVWLARSGDGSKPTGVVIERSLGRAAVPLLDGLPSSWAGGAASIELR